MPAGRMPWVIGMIEHGDPKDLAFYKARVVHPFCTFTPAGGTTDPLAIEHITFCFNLGSAVRADTHGVGNSKAHPGVFVIHQHNITFGGMNGDCVVNNAAAFVSVKTDDTVIGCNRFAGFTHPFIGCKDGVVLATLYLGSDLFAAVGIFSPEIMDGAIFAAFDRPVSPENAAVMCVVI